MKKGDRTPSLKAKICRILNAIKVTLLCGVVTILVLRGTVGLSRFNMPVQEGDELMQTVSVSDHSRTLSGVSTDEPNEEGQDLEQVMDLNTTYTLGPKILDWDEQRQVWLQENHELASTVDRKPRILLATGSPPKPCDKPAGDHYLLKAVKSKIDYCRLHNIDIFYNLAHFL